MECLYYPYSRCLDTNHLKKTLLLFDKLYFLDTEPNAVRYELIRKYQHGFSLDELKQKELISTYAYLQEKKLIEIIDPTNIIENYDALLTSNINSDLNSDDFCKTAICHSTNTWKIMSSRMPKSIRNSFYPGGMSFDEALLLQDVIRSWNNNSSISENSIRFYEWLKRWGAGNRYLDRIRDAAEDVEKAEQIFMKEYSHVIGGNPCMKQEAYEVPFLQASSIRINEALIVCLERGLTPITDSRIHDKLLNIKVQNAFDKIENNVALFKEHDFDLPYAIPKKDLAVKIIDELLPDECLEKMSFADIVNYKLENRELFERFTIKISQLIAAIDETEFDSNYYRTIQRIIDKEVIPELESIKNDMRKSFEKDFGKIILQSAGIIMPVLYASIKGGLTVNQILAACALGELTYLSAAGAETLMDNISNIKNRKSNAFSYLLGLKP